MKMVIIITSEKIHGQFTQTFIERLFLAILLFVSSIVILELIAIDFYFYFSLTDSECKVFCVFCSFHFNKKTDYVKVFLS